MMNVKLHYLRIAVAFIPLLKLQILHLMGIKKKVLQQPILMTTAYCVSSPSQSRSMFHQNEARTPSPRRYSRQSKLPTKPNDYVCPKTRKFVMYLGKSLVSWKRKKQDTFSKSSTKVEYRSVTSATCETISLGNLLHSLGLSSLYLVDLHYDNRLADNHVFHEKLKHFEIDVHLVREKFSAGIIKLLKFILICKLQRFSLNVLELNNFKKISCLKTWNAALIVFNKVRKVFAKDTKVLKMYRWMVLLIEWMANKLWKDMHYASYSILVTYVPDMCHDKRWNVYLYAPVFSIYLYSAICIEFLLSSLELVYGDGSVESDWS
ncbi:hypothetical protein Tco_1012322 [Tanacetum coccineum]